MKTPTAERLRPMRTPSKEQNLPGKRELWVPRQIAFDLSWLPKLGFS
jgi:hypothetical protein